jgi:hypothetical protein
MCTFSQNVVDVMNAVTAAAAAAAATSYLL